MRLSEFILQNLEGIMQDWEAFARTLTPGRDMVTAEMRNDLERMLAFIATDIDSPQTEEQRVAKSQGRARTAPQATLAHEHGLHRFRQSFSLLETISEFRALRASVTGLWLQSQPHADEHCKELVRFNEAIDQAITESTAQVIAQLDRNRDLFLATLSHDLRNPLQAIDISSHVFARATNLTPSQHEVAQRIVDATARIQQMISHLVDFASTRLRQQIALTLQPCDLATIAHRCVDELRIGHHDRRISIAVNGDTRGTWDGPRLAQVLVNLIGNALEHGSQAPDAAVELEIIGDREQVDLWVINVGAPIPADERQAIFEPLRRGRGSPERRGGLGLGLYIVRQIVKAHGGTIELAVSDDRQTVFHLSLPKEPPEQPVLRTPSAATQ